MNISYNLIIEAYLHDIAKDLSNNSITNINTRYDVFLSTTSIIRQLVYRLGQSNNEDFIKRKELSLSIK